MSAGFVTGEWAEDELIVGVKASLCPQITFRYSHPRLSTLLAKVSSLFKTPSKFALLDLSSDLLGPTTSWPAQSWSYSEIKSF